VEARLEPSEPVSVGDHWLAAANKALDSVVELKKLRDVPSWLLSKVTEHVGEVVREINVQSTGLKSRLKALEPDRNTAWLLARAGQT
jgi:hypothetical protein